MKIVVYIGTIIILNRELKTKPNFVKIMAFIGSNQYNHGQEIDEYDYDDVDEFYGNNINSFNANNYHGIDDSEGKTFSYVKKFK